jgi:hypothetical protein
MAIGDLLFSIISANATVDVEAGTPSLSGGTTYTWAAVASGVNVLVTQTQGGRDFANGVYNQRGQYAVAGVDPSLDRSDVRLKVVTAAPGLQWLVGRYLSVAASAGHSRGAGGILPARINLNCVIQEVPADDGSVL